MADNTSMVPAGTDSKAKVIIYSLAVLCAAIAIGTAIWRFAIERDYLLYMNVPCDPATEEYCFEGDGENTPLAYKEIAKRASHVPACNGWADECSYLACEVDEQDCSITYCDPEDEEQTCVLPDEAPPEVESAQE